VAHRHARPRARLARTGRYAERARHRAGGRAVASGNAGGTVRLWSTSASRPQRSFRAHEGRVTALAFAAGNDRVLATAGDDGQVKLWDMRGRGTPRVFRGHAEPGARARVLGRWRRLHSAGQDGVIRIWSNLAQPPRE
jgi:WD40 repeat protein